MSRAFRAPTLELDCGGGSFGAIAAVWFDKDGTLAEVSGFLLLLGRSRVRSLMAEVQAQAELGLSPGQVRGLGDRLGRALGLRGGSGDGSGDGFEFEDVDLAGPLAVAPRADNERAAARVLTELGISWERARAIAATAFATADGGLGRKADRTPPFADVEPCLTRLHRAGLRLGMVSADRPDLTADFVVRYGLGDRITAVWGSSEQLAKPDPELLRRGCQAMGVSPAQVVVVGDSALDIQLARSAGAAGVIGLARSREGAAAVAGADVIIASLDALTVRPHGPGDGPEDNPEGH